MGSSELEWVVVCGPEKHVYDSDGDDGEGDFQDLFLFF